MPWTTIQNSFDLRDLQITAYSDSAIVMWLSSLPLWGPSLHSRRAVMIPRSHIISEHSNYGLYRHRTEGNQEGDCRDVPLKLSAVLVFAVCWVREGRLWPRLSLSWRWRSRAGRRRGLRACVRARDEITDCRSQWNMRDIKLPVEFSFNASGNCTIPRRCR